MKKAFTPIILILTLFFIGPGCFNSNEEIDLDPPHIELFQPVEGEKYPAGSPVFFEATFTDNVALSTFSIDIHSDIDNHAHGRMLEDSDLLDFTYKESFETPETGTYTAILENEIQVPGNSMAGPYHFIVQAIDAEGNATGYQDNSTVEIEILITNGSMAQVEITNLNNNGELDIEAGQAFIVEGSITDPDHATLQGIEDILIILGESREEDHDHASSRILEENLYELHIPLEELTNYENQEGILDISKMIHYTMSSEVANGLQNTGIDHLELMFQVIDLQGNYTIEIFPVHLPEN